MLDEKLKLHPIDQAAPSPAHTDWTIKHTLRTKPVFSEYLDCIRT